MELLYQGKIFDRTYELVTAGSEMWSLSLVRHHIKVRIYLIVRKPGAWTPLTICCLYTSISCKKKEIRIGRDSRPFSHYPFCHSVPFLVQKLSVKFCPSFMRMLIKYRFITLFILCSQTVVEILPFSWDNCPSSSSSFAISPTEIGSPTAPTAALAFARSSWQNQKKAVLQKKTRNLLE